MDPLEFRMKNLPPEAPNAMWRKYFPIAAEMFGWSKRHPTGDPTPGPIKRGMGCAANQWGGGGRGTKAHCEIASDGSVVDALRHAGHRRRARKTTVTMIAAETLGVPIEAVKAEIGDTNYPFSGGSGGSTTAPSVVAGHSRHRRQGARRAEGADRAGAGRRPGRRWSQRTAAFNRKTIRRRA